MNVYSFWHDVLSQNRATLSSYFCDDAVIRWHCTNEQFTVSEFIRANCDYPGSWEGKIERVERFGDHIVTIVKVVSSDGSSSFHAVSFFVIKDGRIQALDEYWADDGDAPVWRKEMMLGKPIDKTGR